MGGDDTVTTRTTEYDHWMEAMKGIGKLGTKDKLMHLRWIDNIITKDKEDTEWLAPTMNDNVLSPDKESSEACIMSEYLLNIPRIIATEMRERVVKDHTTLPFPRLVYQLCMESGVPAFPNIDHMIMNIRTADIALIKDNLNSTFM
ncbi:hypothetical protein HAX54_027357, partial [Datura stramonium]|nr:hypothetical protein [Datura stramonium]